MLRFCLALLIIPFFGLSQQNYLPVESFYKDQILHAQNGQVYKGFSIFPVIESEKGLPALYDTAEYSNYFQRALFKQHLFEVKGENYQLSVSPLFNLSAGIDLLDTGNTVLYQNTRGFIVEGDLFNNFSFSTSFYENQARFSDYQRIFYNAAGEYYPNETGYYQVNAVIPNAARTKPFKTLGYDYGYAIGNFVYKPTKSIVLSAGNNEQFIGSGYRSLFYSDNNAPAPYFKAVFEFLGKFRYDFHRSRLMDLYRQDFSASAEAYYRPKLFGMNILSFQVFDNLNISLFEGTVWSKSDSSGTKAVSPLFYNPVPLVSLISDAQESFTVYGLDLSLLLNSKNRVYGQLAFSNNSVADPAFQVGYRTSELFGQNWFIQLEYNQVVRDFYHNATIAYSHNNLSIAHIKSDNFEEFVFRSGYRLKRLGLDVKAILYKQENIAHIPEDSFYGPTVAYNGNTIHLQSDLYYRFNAKTNLQIFASGVFRKDYAVRQNLIFMAGIRTNLRNNYTDF